MTMVTKSNFLIIVIITIYYVESIMGKSSNSIIKLTHPLSTYSPFHNPNTTGIDMINASRARFNSVQAKTPNMTMLPSDYKTPLFPLSNKLGFLAYVGIGTPPVSQFLIMDTGSFWTWAQCKGCEECKEHRGPMYDRALSKSDAPVNCRTPLCTLISQNQCDSDNSCEYFVEYGDGSHSQGVAVTETFTFMEGSKPSNNVIIGCGLNNNAYREEDSSGVLGLGASVLSLSTRLGSMFSYCIGNLIDPSPEHHFLMIGSGAIIRGMPSPLTMANGFYYVSLEGIAVGDVNLNIDPDVFKLKEDRTGGVIIDSGSTFSYLVTPAYEALKTEVARIITGLPILKLDNHPDLLCYDGWARRDVKGFPIVTLQFAGGQTLQVDANNLFHQVYNPEVFCLSFDKSARSDMRSTIGLFAQQDYNVGYDIHSKTIHFERASCERLAREAYL